MISLKTLGAIDLSATDGRDVHAVLAQPKRLALLAYLALAQPRSAHRRDVLLSLFWPEQDAEHARNALSQAVYFLRRALGADVLLPGPGDTLGLRVEAVQCDAWEFERAISERRNAAAVELYRGALLPGLHVADAAPELEQWLDDERARLARLNERALEQVAVEREAAHDFAGAAIWWRRLVAADPLSSRIALRLVRSLAASGDRAAAIRHAQSHERLVRDEIGVAPDGELSAFMEQLHSSHPISHAAGSERRFSALPPAASETATSAPSPVMPTPPTPDVAPVPTSGSARAPTRRRVAAAAVVAAIVITGSVIAAGGRKVKPPAARPAIATNPSSLSVRQPDPASAELYLRARYSWRSRNPAAIREAMLLYHEAIQHDSTFALAWAGLADAYRFYGGLNYGSYHDYMDSARIAVARALTLDSTLSQAHTTVASLFTDAADWDSAEREYRRAIALEPANALAHHWYAIFLATLDRRDEALREIRLAHRLDSLSGPLNRALSQIESFAGVSDPTFANPERRPIVDASFKNDHADRARYLALQGQCAQAAGEVATAYTLSPADAMVAAADVQVHMRCGDRRGARMVVLQMERRPDARLTTIYIAMAHTQLGELDSAFAWLAREQSWGMVKRFELRTSIYLQPLRADPRYPELLARIGIH
jgi:DNA-binding SARP family transcriptional activator